MINLDADDKKWVIDHMTVGVHGVSKSAADVPKHRVEGQFKILAAFSEEELQEG